MEDVLGFILYIFMVFLLVPTGWLTIKVVTLGCYPKESLAKAIERGFLGAVGYASLGLLVLVLMLIGLFSL